MWRGRCTKKAFDVIFGAVEGMLHLGRDGIGKEFRFCPAIQGLGSVDSQDPNFASRMTIKLLYSDIKCSEMHTESPTPSTPCINVTQPKVSSPLVSTGLYSPCSRCSSVSRAPQYSVAASNVLNTNTSVPSMIITDGDIITTSAFDVQTVITHCAEFETVLPVKVSSSQSLHIQSIRRICSISFIASVTGDPSSLRWTHHRD